MAWDIYGNPLQRGHCEAHPHVHEEYPCSVCMSECGQTQQPHNALQQLQYEFAQQGDYIKQLEAERDALLVKVEALLSAINDVASSGKTSGFGVEPPESVRKQRLAWMRLNELRQKTPQQCLAEIKAQVANDVAVYICDRAFKGALLTGNVIEFASEYAATVRQGGA